MEEGTKQTALNENFQRIMIHYINDLCVIAFQQVCKKLSDMDHNLLFSTRSQVRVTAFCSGARDNLNSDTLKDRA